MRTPFVFKLLFIAALAVGVVYLVKPSLLPLAQFKNSRPVFSILKEKIAAAAGAEPSASASASARHGENAATPASSNPIVKCLVNGRVLYTNDKCPAKASEETLSLQKWAGVAAPNKDLLAEISAQREAAHRQQEQARKPEDGEAGATAPAAKKIRCNALVLEADELLERGRQASTLEEGEQIARQKAALQVRADQAGCEQAPARR